MRKRKQYNSAPLPFQGTKAQVRKRVRKDITAIP